MPGSAAAPQLTAMVALSSADDDLPEVGSSSIEVSLSEGADAAVWQAIGLFAAPIASVQNAAALNASFEVYGGT